MGVGGGGLQTGFYENSNWSQRKIIRGYVPVLHQPEVLGKDGDEHDNYLAEIITNHKLPGVPMLTLPKSKQIHMEI
jgi:hypothetical protein